MKIAFFGSSLVSAYWNGAATYYRGLLKALAERGHQISFYEPDAFDRQAHRDMEDPPWARVHVYPATQEGMERCFDHARTSDWIIKASGVGVLDAELEAGVLTLRKPGTGIAFWDVDAPATLSRIAEDDADPFLHLIAQYDFVFTYGGGPPVVAEYQARGARRCVPVYNALDPSTHFRTAPEPRFETDLLFLGNRLPDREARVESFFLRPAARLPSGRFMLGGNGWDDKPLPRNVTSLGHVYTRDHNALNSTALAVLNINRNSMAKYGYSPPTRIFEAAGAAACVITDAWKGIELFLEPGREIWVVQSGDEVQALVGTMSVRDARRMGRAGQKRILAQHTYRHRAQQVERVLEGMA